LPESVGQLINLSSLGLTIRVLHHEFHHVAKAVKALLHMGFRHPSLESSHGMDYPW
jgi:hypothetical protein